MKALKNSVLFGSVLFAVLAVTTKAIMIYLTDPNTALSTYPGPYASVTISLQTNASYADILFQGLTSGDYAYYFGGVDAVALNLNGAVSVDSGIIGVPRPVYGAGTGDWTLTGSRNVSGFGSFNFTIRDDDGVNQSASKIVFTVHKTSGPWSDDADVLVANASGYLAAAHIFVFDKDGAYTDALKTGFAGNGDVPNVPDGGTTVVMLGIAVLGLGYLARSRY